MKFEVNKSNHTIDISREFEASQASVWTAFTTKEGLDAWWAPAPWKSKTTQMDFKTGGKRVYAMVGPAGEEHWAVQIFEAISAQDSFEFEDAFSDKDGVINATMPSMHWSLKFSSSGAKCTVSILIKAKSLEALEQSIKMGFKEGFTMTLDALAAQLSTAKK